MLVVTLVQVHVRDRRHLLRVQGRHAVRSGRPRRAVPPGHRLLHPGGEPLRRTVADHPDHQRRHPGADARGDVLHPAGRRADHHRRRRVHGGPRGRRPVVDPAGQRPGPGGQRRLRRLADGPDVPDDAGAHRPGEQGAPRADHRHPGGPGLRPRARRGRPLRRGQHLAHRDLAHGRPPAGLHVPDGAARAQRVERGGDLVRRQPGGHRRAADRLAGRVPQLPGADPDVGDDGHLRGGRWCPAPRCAPTASRRCSTRRRRSRRRRRPITELRRPRSTLELRDVGFHYPGAEAPVLSDITLRPEPAPRPPSSAAPARARRRCSTWSRGCSTRRRARCSSTASTSATSTRSCSGAASAWCRRSRTCSPARWRRNLRYADPDATDEELWQALEIAQADRLRAGHAGSARRADHAGRHQRVRRPAPAPGHRPGARPQARDLPVRRLVLGARPGHRRPAAGRARRRSRPTPR